MNEVITFEMPVWVFLLISAMWIITTILQLWLAKWRDKLWHFGDKKLGGMPNDQQN